jgi:hypothetical protein
LTMAARWQERDDDRSRPDDGGSTVRLRAGGEPDRHPTVPRGHEREWDERDTGECNIDLMQPRNPLDYRVLG